MILITTKRGSKGAPKFNMNYTFTLQQPTRLPTFLGSYDHAVLRNESLANDGARRRSPKRISNTTGWAIRPTPTPTTTT